VLLMLTTGSGFTSVLSMLSAGVTLIFSINRVRATGSVTGAITCLLLVKPSGLKLEQLLNAITNPIAGNNCLTITSFF